MEDPVVQSAAAYVNDQSLFRWLVRLVPVGSGGGERFCPYWGLRRGNHSRFDLTRRRPRAPGANVFLRADRVDAFQLIAIGGGAGWSIVEVNLRW